MDLDHVLDIDGGSLVSDRAAMAAAFDKARQSGNPIVIHFHGGLVSRASALAGAPALQAFYQNANAYSIIPVWKTGPWEVARDIWVKIAAEVLFKILVDRVTGFVHARMHDFLGSRSANVQRTLGKVTEGVMAESATGVGDFSIAFLGLDVASVRGNEDLALREFQEASIEAAVQDDYELNTVVDAVLQGAGLEVQEGARAAGTAKAPYTLESVADRDALRQLQGEANARGLGVGTALAIVEIVGKVIARFIKRSDHGLHATVVEEVLRKFYLGAVGTAAWSKMKEYTQNAFSPATPNASGTALIEELKKVPAAQRVMFAGHSAGAIFVCEFFKHAGGIGRQFEVVFMAPAVTVKLFTGTVAGTGQSLLAPHKSGVKFRMFSMSDRFECRDTLVRNVPVLGDLTWFYPRSLLYLISGILEQEDGKEVVDSAIAGLQRDYDPSFRLASDPQVSEARSFIESHPERRVWSVQDHPDARFRSNSTSHGGFGAPVAGNTTMESVAAILKQDW
jgi:hypothetical protein